MDHAGHYRVTFYRIIVVLSVYVQLIAALTVDIVVCLMWTVSV